MPLTELAIKHLKPQVESYRAVDGGGLYIEVSPAGGKLWRWRYRFQGKGQILSLGKYPVVSLAKARKLRDEAREQVKLGNHPTRYKKAQKLRRMYEGENTFEKIARNWLEMKQVGLNEKYRAHCMACMERHIFPAIGALPINEITIPDVVNAIEKLAKRGTVETAKRMKQLIGQVFRYAAQRGLCVHNPAADLRDILPTPEKKHHAAVHPSEFADLLKATEAYQGDQLTKGAMNLLALTFVRTGELIGAKWDEIDWDRQEWRIPKERMKMKRPHMVPLSKQSREILKDLHKITGSKVHIFHSNISEAKHISNGTILVALRRMGYQNKMTGHGYRSLASTILNEKGYAPDVIERQLAHEDQDKIRSAYNRAEYLLDRKKMMQDYADYLDSLKQSDGKKVIAFKKTERKNA